MKFSTEIIKSFLVDYSEVYILVTGNITVVGRNNNTNVAFKNCRPFTWSIIHLNDEHVETAENLDLTTNLYNLIEYSDNYADTTASLYQYKRPEQPKDNNGELAHVTIDNSSSFKYKSNLLKKITPRIVAANVDPNIAGANRLWPNAKIVVPLKYISNFFRSFLNWTKDSIMSDNAGITAFQITKTGLYALVVTLNTGNNKKFSDLLKKGFKRSVFWNQCKSKIQTIQAGYVNANVGLKRILLDSSFQGVNRLFLMGFNNAAGGNRVERNSSQKYLLPRVDIKDYNVLIDGRNFYDQPINDEIKMYDKIRRVAPGKGDDFTTGCLSDFHYFKQHYKLVACDLSKQAILDSDPRAIQEIEFVYKFDNDINVQILTILEKEKQTILEFGKGTVKVL